MTNRSKPPEKLSFAGARVVCFGGRRGDEMADMVAELSGVPFAAPALREVPMEPGPDVVELAARLRRRDIDGLLFLTPGGARFLPEALRGILPRAELDAALAGATIAARGPKTLDAVKALFPEHPRVVGSDEPHTHKELVRAFDRAAGLAGSSLAVIEHGVPHARLRAALMDAGANVLSVAIYKFAPPKDAAPLAAAVERIAEGAADVVLFTNGAQVEAAMRLATERELADALRAGLERALVGAIGQVTADKLRALDIEPDVVPEHARIAELVRAAAMRVTDIRTKKETGS
jgi:uroporphyrinogen-III synthase